LKTESFDAIHLLETQHAGYLYLQSIRSVGKSLPVGLSVWGSDLAWFNKSKRHNKRIGKVLENTDLLFIECCRDIELALEFGYRGGFTPPIPASGGVASAEAFLAEQENLLPSERKKIVVKGYTGFVGRARTALRVIEKNANRLENYSIDVYSASFATVVRLWAMRRRTRLRIHGHRKKSLTHSEVLQLFRDARVSMAVSLSDGLPGSFREAVWTGAFPIESNGSCVNEWMTSSNDCIIVDPENIESISSALLRAIQDDTMVDNARTANRRLAEKFTTENIRELSLSQYARLWEIKELESYR
jgi:glycosyltransferase involved in cell wall biosynthesis